MKLASDIVGLFAYLFVMGSLLPFDPPAGLLAGRET